MNNFSVYIKENGIYNKINAVSVFPFNFGQLLDEQLDEARLIIKLSQNKHYEPLTEIRIDFLNRDGDKSNVLESKYFVVAQDKSREFPVGKGTYTHELYLIERTKLLEGVFCQSLTFTNPLINNYLKEKIKPHAFLSNIEYMGGNGNEAMTENFWTDCDVLPNIETPVLLDEMVNLPSMQEMAESVSKAYNKLVKNSTTKYKYYMGNIRAFSVNDESSNIYSEAIIENGGETKVFSIKDYEKGSEQEKTFLNSKITFLAKSRIKVKYNLFFSYQFFTVENLDFEYSTGYTGDMAMTVEFVVFGVKNRHQLKPWTITDVINRVLDLAEPIMNEERPRYMFNRLQSEKYANIKAPEFTMTQCTLREQLKIIGGYIHAEPRLGGYDENGVYQENWIFFDEYGTGKQASLANAPYVYKGSSTDISQYCTDIQTNASNIVNSLNYAQGVIIDPDNTNTQTLRTESINVKLTESNSRVSTILPIYKITKVECGLYDDEGNWIVEPKDITSYVFEAHEYHSTLSSYGGTYPYAKCYAIYYTQGQNGIDGLFFKSDNADDSMWENYAISNILNAVNGRTDLNSKIENYFPSLAFRISYLPIYDAKFSHNKQLIIPTNKRFSQIYNQSENLIETSYYGENIKGVAQRLGNVEQTRTYMLSDISQIPKAGQMLDGYVISAVTTEIMPFYIKCTVALSKDFNRISQFVGINSNKRIAEVSERQAYKRDILLKDYIVFTDKPSKYTKQPIAFENYDAIKCAFGYIASPKITPVTAAICTHLDYNGGTINETSIKLPVISSSFGNSILFSWQYKDNYSAGEQVFKGEQNQLIDGNKEKVTAYWQTDVPYCDYYGRVYYYLFSLFNNMSDLGLDQALTVNYNSGSYSDCDMQSNIGYILRKDSREILNFNYEVEFVTDRPKTIIGSALASNCPLVQLQTNAGTPEVYFFDHEIGTFDKNIDTETGTKGILQYSEEYNAISVTFPTDNNGIVTSFKSWAIVTPTYDGEEITYQDENGNIETITEKHGGEILIACNKSNEDYLDDFKIGKGYPDIDVIYFSATSNPYNE